MPWDTILLTKRKEYSDEIIQITKERFLSICKDLYKKACTQNRVSRFLLRDFQMELKNVASWSSDDIENKCKKFSEVNCLQRLLYNVHAVNIKLFAKGTSIKMLNVKIPKPEQYSIKDFVFTTCLFMARELWKNPSLLYDKVETQEMLKNMKILDKVVVDAIKQGLRKLVPVEFCEEKIETLSLSESGSGSDSDSDSESNSDSRSVSGSETEIESESESDPESQELVESPSDTDEEPPQPVKRISIEKENIYKDHNTHTPSESGDSDTIISDDEPESVRKMDTNPRLPPKDEATPTDTKAIHDEFILDDVSEIAAPVAKHTPTQDNTIKPEKRRSSTMSKRSLMNNNLDTYKKYYRNSELKYFVNKNKLANKESFF